MTSRHQQYCELVAVISDHVGGGDRAASRALGLGHMTLRYRLTHPGSFREEMMYAAIKVAELIGIKQLPPVRSVIKQRVNCYRCQYLHKHDVEKMWLCEKHPNYSRQPTFPFRSSNCKDYHA